MLEALIFDVDGTLADTERYGHRVAFNLAFAEHGLDWCWDEALYGDLLTVTGGKERIRFFLERNRPGFPIAATELDDWIAELHAAKTRHYLALLEHGRIPPRPGVERVLKEALAAGIRLAIATTTNQENVDALLLRSFAPELRDAFEVIGAGDIVASKKPAPDIYLHVLGALQIAPDRCLAVEDSSAGLIAATDAALPVIITVNDYTREQNFAGALAVLENFDEPQTLSTTEVGDVPLGQEPLVGIELLTRLHDHWTCKRR